MEDGNTNGCNMQLSQEPVPLYKALNEPFHATSRSPSSIANQAWLRLRSPCTKPCGFLLLLRRLSSKSWRRTSEDGGRSF